MMDANDGWRTRDDSETEALQGAKKGHRTGNHPVGYGKPPVGGRFKPGQSGNPKGRPKKKERSNTSRQMVSDFLNAIEREVTITIDGKRKKMPFIEAIYEQAAIKAAKGDYKFFAKIVEMQRQAIALSAILNPKLTQMLESIEQHAAENSYTSPASRDFIDQVNELRRKTRKL